MRPTLFRRRDILKGVALMGFSGSAFGGYGVASVFQQRVTPYTLTPPGWPAGFKIKLVILADLHVCEPWMSLARVEEIVEQTNGLGADAVLLLGDYVVSKRMRRFSSVPMFGEWASLLARLKAPFGVHAVLGNHDWWDDLEALKRRGGPVAAGLALEAAGIPVYENKAVRIEKDGRAFWLAGLGDQWALFAPPGGQPGGRRDRGRHYVGMDDLSGTLAQVTDDAPIILMAHEPDIFPEVPARVSLTLSGHTHGGQLNLFGFTPIVPSRFGSRYVYGHKVEDERHLIVSGGLGCSGLPLRIGTHPEIVVVELGGEVSA